MPPFEIENLNSLKQWEGREFPATDWFVVTQDRIQKFADATGDRQWIRGWTRNAPSANRPSAAPWPMVF